MKNKITMAVMACFSAQALAIGLPDVPLQVGGVVDPNIMVILDDSGSMQFEITPEKYILSTARYIFPRANDVYGVGEDYDNRVPTILAGSVYGMLTRSPQVNVSFYNPSIQYKPWVKADGSSYGPASTTCALHNPLHPGVTTSKCRDLTVKIVNYNAVNWVNCTSPTVCASTGVLPNANFWAATYFNFSGNINNAAQVWDSAKYTRIQIIPAVTSYTDGDRSKREDCANRLTNSCNYTEEIKNFANWYTYHRSRSNSAKYGLGRAMYLQGDDIRVGFGSINKGSTSVDGANTGTIITGVRKFDTVGKTSFFNELYLTNPHDGTPLRRALDHAGIYFSRTASSTVGSPYSTTPAAGGTELSCRQNYTLLTTDGYWTDDTSSDADTAAAKLNVDNTNGVNITGPGAASYQYTAPNPYKDTKSNTLADVAMYYWKNDLRGLTNNVPVNGVDPAFWQHMVTIGIGFGVNGSVSKSAALSAVDTSSAIAWPDPFSSDEAKTDDFLHASINGHGDFFSAKNPDEFAKALDDAIEAISSRSGSASSVSLNSTQISSNTQVFQAIFDTSKWSGDVIAYPVTTSGVGSTPNWKASSSMPAHASRNIWSVFGGVAKTFKFSTLSSADLLSLGVNGDADRINYIRGDRSKEKLNGGTFRNRALNNVLGDIVHSTPFYVNETNTIYVNSGDGMLHSFNANTGVELFAFMPSSSHAIIEDYANATYMHEFTTDGDVVVSTLSQTPGKNILVGLLGHGGKGFFGLDVTDPTTFNATKYLWSVGNTDGDIGYMTGKPQIAKTKAGTFLIVGNGYNSTNGHAVLMVYNIVDGSLVKRIDTGIGSDNGLAAPGLIDMDNDGKIDYAYAGDLKGNVWKFDIQSATSSDWAVANSGSPLFVAKNLSNIEQPITAQILISKNTNASDFNYGKPFVFFGTGSYMTNSDRSNTDIQSLYGLIDEGSTVTRSDLVTRSIVEDGTVGGFAVRVTSESTPILSPKLGWVLDFTTQPGERVTTSSKIIKAAASTLIVSSIIPSSGINPCDPGSRGYLNALDPWTGGRFNFGLMDINGDGDFTNDKLNGNFVSGIDFGIGMPSEPAVVGNRLVVGGSSGSIKDVVINLGTPPKAGRISWKEIKRSN